MRIVVYTESYEPITIIELDTAQFNYLKREGRGHRLRVPVMRSLYYGPPTDPTYAEGRFEPEGLRWADREVRPVLIAKGEGFGAQLMQNPIAVQGYVNSLPGMPPSRRDRREQVLYDELRANVRGTVGVTSPMPAAQGLANAIDESLLRQARDPDWPLSWREGTRVNIRGTARFRHSAEAPPAAANVAVSQEAMTYEDIIRAADALDAL